MAKKMKRPKNEYDESYHCYDCEYWHEPFASGSGSVEDYRSYCEVYDGGRQGGNSRCKHFSPRGEMKPGVDCYGQPVHEMTRHEYDEWRRNQYDTDRAVEFGQY